MNPCHVDITIVGGGIAGLWTLALAVKKGYHAILLEKEGLGAGQTLASQGIIHGGAKYALGATITNATRVITAMPGLWQQAHSGAGPIDLRHAIRLAEHQYLVPASGIDTQLLSFLGSKSMSSHTETVRAKELPEEYRQCGIQQSIFRLGEPVFDVRSVVECFHRQFGERIFSAALQPGQVTESVEGVTLSLENGVRITSSHLVFAIGEGFAQLQRSTPPMQLRPLQMVMAQGKNLPAIYAHFIGRSTKPLLTITSHPCNGKGETVWYLGGGLAEDGVGKTAVEQIATARKLLGKLVPGIARDESLQFSTYRINRAEPQQQGLTRPDDAFVCRDGRIITGWPTKLALAPRFAEMVLNEITAAPQPSAEKELPSLPRPGIGHYPWQRLGGNAHA